jgi:hypothetical protein
MGGDLNRGGGLFPFGSYLRFRFGEDENEWEGLCVRYGRKGATKQARSHSGACDRSPSSTRVARKRCAARERGYPQPVFLLPSSCPLMTERNGWLNLFSYHPLAALASGREDGRGFDAGCRMLDAGCWMLDAGSLMLGIGGLLVNLRVFVSSCETMVIPG